MPDLPTLTVTSAQATRMLAAYGARDATKTPTENYKAWLKEKIIEEVVAFERQQQQVTFRDQQIERDRQAIIALGGTDPTPPQNE